MPNAHILLKSFVSLNTVWRHQTNISKTCNNDILNYVAVDSKSNRRRREWANHVKSGFTKLMMIRIIINDKKNKKASQAEERT